MLHFQRGATYTFMMIAVPAAHPFYMSTDSVGAGQGVYSDGVVGNFATVSATLCSIEALLSS